MKLFNFLTKDQQEQKNIAYAGSSDIFRGVYSQLMTGPLTQAFRVELGYSNTQMGLVGTPGWFVNFAMTFFSSFFADKIKKRAIALCLMFLGMGFVPLADLIIQLGPESLRQTNVAFYIQMVAGTIVAPFSAMAAVLITTLYIRAIRNNIRGRYIAITGIVSGLIGFALALLAPIALKYLTFPYGYSCWSVTLLVFLSISAILLLKVTELPDLKEKTLPPKSSPFKNFANVVKLKEFQILMPANILRGFGDGAGGFIIAVAMKQGLNTETVGWATAVLPLGSLCATGSIGVCSDKFGAGKLLPIINTLLVIGLIGSLFCMKQTMLSSSAFFLCCYFLWFMMSQMEANAIPLVHYDVVPTEVIGAFTGVRLFCLNVTMGLSGLLVGIALDHTKAIIVFGICGALKIIAGFLYYSSMVLLKHNK